MQEDNFKVAIRVRPPLSREIDSTFGFSPIVEVFENKQVCIVEYMGAASNDMEREEDIHQNPSLVIPHEFTFDCVYDMDATQEEVYDNTAKPAVEAVMDGYNATLLAYGQTGTGKTYTMEGFSYEANSPSRGILPRALEDVFKFIQSDSGAKFNVRVSYLQIYNEVISDLLKNDRSSLLIREEKRKGVFVEGLSEWIVRNPNEISSLMLKGQESRAIACTRMNDLSSRSHAVFIINVEQVFETEFGTEMKVGKLNIVDLAGSERVRVTGATGKRLEESKKINQSLSALGNVISALTDSRARTHIPYRDSKLTRLLEDSLGGNCKTCMMAMISPAFEAFGESLSTLKFANRAKNIKNSPRINEEADQKTMLKKYEMEIKRLKKALEEKSSGFENVEKVVLLEEDKKRAEADKEAAIQALEMKSKECIQEKQEKVILEQKLKGMGIPEFTEEEIQNTPQFKSAFEKAVKELEKTKFAELEREKEAIQHDKQNIERYKQLLLRQRDIMIGLTTRLNERDEYISQLQQDLDTYDSLRAKYDENLVSRDEKIKYLESLLQEKGCEFSFSESYEEQLKYLNEVVQQREDEISKLKSMLSPNRGSCESLTDESKRNKIITNVAESLEIILEELKVSKNSPSAYNSITSLYTTVKQYLDPYTTKENTAPKYSNPHGRALTVDEMLRLKRTEV